MTSKQIHSIQLSTFQMTSRSPGVLSGAFSSQKCTCPGDDMTIEPTLQASITYHLATLPGMSQSSQGATHAMSSSTASPILTPFGSLPRASGVKTLSIHASITLLNQSVSTMSVSPYETKLKSLGFGSMAQGFSPLTVPMHNNASYSRAS